MSTRQHRLAKPARYLVHTFALGCASMFLMTASTQAATVLQFSQTLPADIVTATETNGVTTLATTGNADGGGVSIPVVVSNFNGAPFNPLTPVFETFVNVMSTDAATTSGGTITQTFSGMIEYTSAPGGVGIDYLTATFTNAIFSGSGNSASLTQTAPNVTFTSSLASFGTNTGMALGFTGITPPLGITGGSVASFTAQNAGTFSTTTAAVPEPGALCLGSFAVVIGTFAAYGKKRMKK